MDGTALLAGAALGAAVGAAAAWILAATRNGRAADEASARETALKEQVARLDATLAGEKRALEEKVRLFEDMEKKLRDAFQALSAEALKSNNQAFLELAGTKLAGIQESSKQDLDARKTAIDELLKPMRESLKGVDATLRGVEKEREGAYRALLQQVEGLSKTQIELRSETANLVKALRAPQVRGRWGEIHLRRVVEMAGMVAYCDFQEQVSASAEGGRLRPDLVVRLPGGRKVVVDAKTPLEAYLDAVEAKDDAVRETRLADHARHVREHMKRLSQKSYAEEFQPGVEFVVMFLPGESFFSAALQKDPSLIEAGVEQKVIPSSPTTLIALLRAIHYGWQQERIAENAHLIHEAGRELCDRLRAFVEHYQKVGKGLQTAFDAYDDATRSMQKRLIPAVRRVEGLGAQASERVPDVEAIERTVHRLEDGDFVR